MRRGSIQPLLVASLAMLGCAEDEDTPGGGSADAGLEAGSRDAAAPDAPALDAEAHADGSAELGCEVLGGPCTTRRGCRDGYTCIAEETGTIGGASDPIIGHPEGATEVPYTTWLAGYCSHLGTPTAGGCDPDVADSCPCGACVTLWSTPTGDMTMCAASCAASLTESECRAGYTCVLGSDVCLPGCSSDDECAIDRTEEGLVYDVEGMWTCNPVTYRCEHVPPEGAQAGAPCRTEGECELFGRCLDEPTYPAWPGGYCVKAGCDVEGNGCAGAAVCDVRAFGSPTCLAACEVGATDPVGDPFAPARDCRAGYACFWSGTAAGPSNGVCVPGNYNDVRAANIGSSCDPSGDGRECYSPFGLGSCRDWDGSSGAVGGYCTLFDCGAPGIDSDTICGDGALCAAVSGRETTLCVQTCASAEECGAGLGCWDPSSVGLVTGDRTVCFAGCLDDGQCRTGERCEGASDGAVGSCTAG